MGILRQKQPFPDSAHGLSSSILLGLLNSCIENHCFGTCAVFNVIDVTGCRFRRVKHGGAGIRLKPLVDVIVDHKNVNSALVVDGYQCIDRSLSKVKIRGAQVFRGRRKGRQEEEPGKGEGRAGKGVRQIISLSVILGHHGFIVPSPVFSCTRLTEHVVSANRAGKPNASASVPVSVSQQLVAYFNLNDAVRPLIPVRRTAHTRPKREPLWERQITYGCGGP